MWPTVFAGLEQVHGGWSAVRSVAERAGTAARAQRPTIDFTSDWLDVTSVFQRRQYIPTTTAYDRRYKLGNGLVWWRIPTRRTLHVAATMARHSVTYYSHASWLGCAEPPTITFQCKETIHKINIIGDLHHNINSGTRSPVLIAPLREINLPPIRPFIKHSNTCTQIDAAVSEIRRLEHI